MTVAIWNETSRLSSCIDELRKWLVLSFVQLLAEEMEISFSILPSLHTEIQWSKRKKGSNTLSSSSPLAREYDKEISRPSRLSLAWSEKNGTSGSVEHVPGIGWRTSSAVENSKESGARMYMRADVEIFLKGTAGQDANGGWDRTWGWRWERSGKSLVKGAPPARGFSERNERER